MNGWGSHIQSRQGRGCPSQSEPDGGPPLPVGTGWGVLSQDSEQHSEYLLHGGRYASRIHAGGLSCSVFITADIRRKWQLMFLVYFSVHKEGCPSDWFRIPFQSLVPCPFWGHPSHSFLVPSSFNGPRSFPSGYPSHWFCPKSCLRYCSGFE